MTDAPRRPGGAMPGLSARRTEGQNAQEKLSALRSLWESKRDSEPLPGRGDFDVLELWPWLGHLALIEVIGGGADFRYRLHGTALVDILGTDLTGRRLSELTETMQAVAGREYREALTSREPVSFTRIRFNRTTDHRQVSNLILPLAADGQTIDMLLFAIYFAD